MAFFPQLDRVGGALAVNQRKGLVIDRVSCYYTGEE